MLKQMISAAAVLALVAACETAPSSEGGAAGSGGRFGDGKGMSGRGSGSQGFPTGELARNVPDRVFFSYDSSSLDEDAQGTLRAQAEWLVANPNVKVTVEGHADERGTREYNLALGERRANAAKRFLANAGVKSNRLTTISYGKERPAVPGSDDSAWNQNRRAVTVVN